MSIELVYLAKDKEGKEMYDFGEGKNLIEIKHFYKNGEYQNSKIFPVYLIVKDKEKVEKIEIQVLNEDDSDVKIKIRGSGYKEKLIIENPNRDYYKLLFTYSNKPKFQLVLTYIERE